MSMFTPAELAEEDALADNALGDLAQAIDADLRTAHGLYEAIEYAATAITNGRQGAYWEPVAALLLHICDGAQIETHHMLSLRKALQEMRAAVKAQMLLDLGVGAPVPRLSPEELATAVHQAAGFPGCVPCPPVRGRVASINAPDFLGDDNECCD